MPASAEVRIMGTKVAKRRVLLVGGGGREHAIADALGHSGRVQLAVIAGNHNPGLAALVSIGSMEKHDERDREWIADWSVRRRIDLAIIGAEDPLAAGLTDALVDVGIPVVGPSYNAARLESSKRFARDLMGKHNIPGQVWYRYFDDTVELTKLLRSSRQQFALKPVGLTAGKGVKVMGVQLPSVASAIQYGSMVIQSQIGGEPGLIVEERLVGAEFTLQAFVDGTTVCPGPLVRDYKLAFAGDKGPNTGGMGSYSMSDGLLPDVTADEYAQAVDILKQTVNALHAEGATYQGILYGQFMKVTDGIKVIEFNCRLGDPEAMNILPLLRTDFLTICDAIVERSLEALPVEFERKATVCKYIVPRGYPERPREGPIQIDKARIEALGVRVFIAKVEQGDGVYRTTNSRSVGLVGIGETVAEAEDLVEQSLGYVKGLFDVRHDIGRGVTEAAVPRDISRAAPVAR